MNPSQDDFAEFKNFRNSLIALNALSLAYAWVFQLRSVFIYALAFLLTQWALWLFAWLSARALKVERRHVSQSVENQFVIVQIDVRNSAPFALVAPAVRDFFPPDKIPSHEVSVAGGLSAFGQDRLHYRAVCFNNRGKYTIGPAQCIGHDPFFFFAPSRVLPAESCSELLVLPKIDELPGDLALTYESSLITTPGPQRSPRLGRGMAIHGIREYRPGDPSRIIHWSLSARHRGLVVKEFEQSRNRRWIVALGLEQRSLRGLGQHSNHEYALRASASLYQWALARGEDTALLIHAQKQLSFGFQNSVQIFHHVLEQLARVRSSSSPEFWSFLFSELAKLQGSSGAALVLVLPSRAWSNEVIIQQLRRLMRLGHPLHLLLIDDSSFLPLTMTRYRPEQEREMALELCQLAHSLGIRSSMLANGQDLTEALRDHPITRKLTVKVRKKSA